MNAPYRWIDCASWELDFFGLPHRIPWPAEVSEESAKNTPFEVDHLMTAIEAMGPEAGAPWSGFLAAANHFDELAEALEDAEIVRGRELLEEIERQHPGTSFVVFHQAYVARHEGRVEEAIALYQRAAEKTPQVPEIWNNLGVMLSMAQRRDEAIAAFLKALACAPNDRVALEGLAQLRHVVKLLRKADDPASAVFVDVPTFQKMAADQIAVLASDPDQVLAYGEQLLRDGLAPAIGLAALEKARELRPEHPRTLQALTAAYRQAGEHAKSRETITRYTELYPTDPGGFFHLAQALSAAGETEAERAALDRTLELDPNAQAALGIKFHLTANEHDPAKEQALARHGEERKSWMAFVVASSIARTRGDAKTAVKWAERALELAPEAEEPLLHYTAAIGDAKDVAALARVVKPKVESGKYSKRLDWNYAQVLKQLGLNNDAVNVLRKVMNSDAPEDLKTGCQVSVEAWTGLLTGSGVPLEVHAAGVLLRPVLVELADGDGGVVLGAGSQLPGQGSFPWRAPGAEAEVGLQQGQRGGAREPQSLGLFKVRGIQQTAGQAATIECHVTALPDGAMHFRAAQNGRRLAVGWSPARGLMR